MILFLLYAVNSIHGQEIKKVHSSSWNSFIPKLTLSEHWYLKSEFHFRRTNFVSDWEQLLLRPSIHYKTNDTYDYSLGYSYFRNYAFADFTIPVDANEHNIWQQIALSHTSKKMKFNHRFRLEERFIDKIIQSPGGLYEIRGSTYNNRFRYRLTLNRPVIKVREAKFISLKIFDELWINLDQGIQPKSLNQNWFYAGLDFPLDRHLTFGMGYHHIGLKGGSTTFITNHILQTTVSYAIN